MSDPSAVSSTDETEASSTESRAAVSEKTLYSIVAEPRRRNAIHYLKQRNEPVTVSELAEQIAAWENAKEPEDLTSQERKRVYISLYQSHLPTMDKEGIVDYDADRGTVTLTEGLFNHRIYLEIVPKNDIPWGLYYVGLSIAGVCLISLAWFEVRPFGLVPDLAWAVIMIVLFGVSAFVQTVSSRRREVGDPGPPPEFEID